MNKQELDNYLSELEFGFYTKEEASEKVEDIRSEIADLERELEDIKTALDSWELESATASTTRMYELAGEMVLPVTLEEREGVIEEQLSIYRNFCKCAEEFIQAQRSFNKTRCFANIRELLRHNSSVKIGQIEKEAGVRPGYLSRLEKPDNTAEPTVEFVMTAAKMLGVGLDVLLKQDIASLTPTEQYILSFIDKLKNDTLSDKLEWEVESADYLSEMLECDINGYVDHPLFSYESFYEEGEGDYPDKVDRIVFTSRSYGLHTAICGDCFNLRLKNAVRVYLMNISKSVYKLSDKEAFAKELWLYNPDGSRQFIGGTLGQTQFGPILEQLYAAVAEYHKHPKVRKDLRYAIDAFMKDDLSDDPITEPELPF